jgi:hypothetical protein
MREFSSEEIEDAQKGILKNIETQLDASLELEKQIDKAQRETRQSLIQACESGSAEAIVELSVAIKVLNKAWRLVNKNTQEFHSLYLSRCQSLIK